MTLARQFGCLRLWRRYINYTLHLGLGALCALETSPYLHCASYLSNRKSSPSSFRSEVDWNPESRRDNNGSPSPNQEQECSMPFRRATANRILQPDIRHHSHGFETEWLHVETCFDAESSFIYWKFPCRLLRRQVDQWREFNSNQILPGS